MRPQTNRLLAVEMRVQPWFDLSTMWKLEGHPLCL
jgi:hypothetical protein